MGSTIYFLLPARAAVDANALPPNSRVPNLPTTFEALGENFFSLGQDENYYETLNGFSLELREKILVGLRDCAFDLNIFDAERTQEVMNISLLRSISEENVRGRLHRLSIGDATLTEFQFEYEFPYVDDEINRPKLKFNVIPDSQPPTNVHVLIGRNGVGKTRCMKGLAMTLLGRQANESEPLGAIIIGEAAGQPSSFSGLMMISFSAFDDFDLRPRPEDKLRSQQVGLIHYFQDQDGTDIVGMKNPNILAKDFRDAFSRCRDGLRSRRWRAAVETLETDDLFAEAQVTDLLELDDENWEEAAVRLFKRLSSGHAIVLLTMTRLVELVDERTLVLLDEPEGHLHPPLLSAFIRALSDLLINRNGVAIISTHSPVVLQEVPRTCVWKLRRSGRIAVAERPTVETFGENVGVLTREVFGFEVTNAGFHRLLDISVHEGQPNYQEVLARFDGQVGAEARAIVQALIADRDADRGVME